jgi:hypothetical protein
MQADRSDCSSSAAGVQRILMMVLLSGDQTRWSRAELERELCRPGDDAANVGDAIGALYGVGLVHVSGDLVEATRPARYLDDLLGNPV